ncbi:MAG: phosphatidylserine/phosphatidylglycerophosphate/cardiolipin synthase family protein [Bacteroidales bacterium]
MKTVFFNHLSPQYMLFASPESWISELLIDIQQAKKYIYIETFRLNEDAVGKLLYHALLDRIKDGIDIKIIVDSWGTRKTAMFDNMRNAGIKIRFFKKIVLTLALFKNNHERNHRKIIAIDDQISYIGSANFTEHSLKWRESILRIEGKITPIFKRIFLDNFQSYKKRFITRKYYKTIHYNEFDIIREKPSIGYQQTRKYFIHLINRAKKTLTIVTPYFLPGKSIRNQLAKAVKRGVTVTIIIPKNSDVKTADSLRNLYLGNLYMQGVNIQYFKNENIHAKVIMADDDLFSIGSSNFDYRSFRYMYEINLSGKNVSIASLIKEYIEDTLKNCEPFNYTKWSLRSPLQKLYGIILIPFRKLL